MDRYVPVNVYDRRSLRTTYPNTVGSLYDFTKKMNVYWIFQPEISSGADVPEEDGTDKGLRQSVGEKTFQVFFCFLWTRSSMAAEWL